MAQENREICTGQVILQPIPFKSDRLLDPDIIVLGGGMSNIERLYENVPRIWGRYVFSDRVDTRLVRNRFGDSSGVRGAAWLWQ